MDLLYKLIETGVDQVLEFAEVPPPLVHAWSQQAWSDVAMAGASFVPHITLITGLIGLALYPNWIAAYTFAGLFFNKAVNMVLKYSIRQPRPVNPWKKGHGMPSDHAQFMGYAVCFSILLYGFLQKHRQDLAIPPKIALIIPFSIAMFVCYSRLAIGVHSTGQVVFGFVAGVFFAVFWYYLGVFLYPRIAGVAHTQVRVKAD